ncbi:MAG: 3-phosphoshikimate 1-carboxyvinyltransferase [Rickettsiales bacterium]|nr:MAG: 3-phosphoshikimate 1-carboxyvinyltransferase [Rickettsiales bacterium]
MIVFSKQTDAIFANSSYFYNEDISCYALILGSLAKNNTIINNLAKTYKVSILMKILEQLGIKITEQDGKVLVEGKDRVFTEPTNFLDIKDSRDILYLIIGLLASYDYKVFFRADDSLSDMDIEEILSCYTNLGVKFVSRNDKYLPILMYGNKNIKQVKATASNILLKKPLLLTSLSLQTNNNLIEEKSLSEDYLEDMLKVFGVEFKEASIGNQDIGRNIGKTILIQTQTKIVGQQITIPSNVIFLNYIAALAVLLPNSNITIKSVILTNFNDYFIRFLTDISADITIQNRHFDSGYRVADVTIKYSQLKDIGIIVSNVKKLMQEYYLLFLIASVSGISITIQDIDYLKQVDEINFNFMLNLLKGLGVSYTETKQILAINGKIKNYDVKIDTNGITNTSLLMALGFFGLFLNKPVEISTDEIEKKYPNFLSILQELKLNVK